MEVNKNEAWPFNLLCRIFDQEELEIEETLTERETYILYSFYRDRMRMRDIGERYGIQAERCRQIREKAIRRIKHPSRAKYLVYGMAEVARRDMEPPKVIPIEKCDIVELDLSVRAFNCLRRANITTIERLTQYSKAQLSKLRNMGVGTLAEVERKLNERGLALRQDDV